MNKPERRNYSAGTVLGASPAQNKFYVLLFFDISEIKLYQHLIRIVKKYCNRVQKSVFEAYLTSSQIKDLASELEYVLSGDIAQDDVVRIVRISGHCEVTELGKGVDNVYEDDIFI